MSSQVKCIYTHQLKGLVIDEAHCVSKWLLLLANANDHHGFRGDSTQTGRGSAHVA